MRLLIIGFKLFTLILGVITISRVFIGLVTLNLPFYMVALGAFVITLCIMAMFYIIFPSNKE